MGTRSSIGMEHPDGSVTAIYCHWDGYHSYNGVILFENYRDPFKLVELLDLGDISSLGKEIGVKHDFDTREGDAFVTAYHRDRGEPREDTKPKTYDNVDAWIGANGQEYNYLLDMDGVWHVAKGWGYNGKDSWEPLETVLVRENLIRVS